MNARLEEIINKLSTEKSLDLKEYEYLVKNRSEEAQGLLQTIAHGEKLKHYGCGVFVRGLIEISNICKNDCLYCGIRCGNSEAQRYRLSKDEILASCEAGHALGLRSFVLQGGEDPYFTDEVLEDIVSQIKCRFPDSAVTLSLGERSRESYERLYKAGTDRYLLRHETATKAHYERLHPREMSYDNRIKCLYDLKEIGYQVGCGFMVGSPYQTDENIAGDLKFIEQFKPDMCGIGPFIPHKRSVFSDFPSGSVELTCYLLSIIRIMHPKVLLPATTALGTLLDGGREMGILAGANVVMPNLSPQSVRAKYDLYDGKLYSKSESAEALFELSARLEKIGHHIEYTRGDALK